MSHPTLVAALETYTPFGAFAVEREAAAGETTLEVSLPLRAGRWRAWLLESEQLDALVGDGDAAEDARQQLLLVHTDAGEPTATIFRGLGHVASIDIEGAHFTVACRSVASALAAADGFDEHLDGVHGALASGRGVHVMLDGDGTADIWCDPRGLVALIEL